MTGPHCGGGQCQQQVQQQNGMDALEIRKNYGNEQKPLQNGAGGNGSGSGGGGGGGGGNDNGPSLAGGFGAVSRQPAGARHMFMMAVAAATTTANRGQHQTLGKAGTTNTSSQWTTYYGKFTDSENSDDNDDEDKDDGNKDGNDEDEDNDGTEKTVEMDENGKEEKMDMANEQKLIGGNEGKKGEVEGKAEEVETSGKEWKEKDENPQQQQQQNGRRNSI